MTLTLAPLTLKTLRCHWCGPFLVRRWTIVDPHSVAIDRPAISKSQTTAQQEKPSGHGAAVVKPYSSQPTFARGCMGQPLQPHIDPEVSTSQFIGGGGCPVQLLVKIGCENRRLQCGMVRLQFNHYLLRRQVWPCGPRFGGSWSRQQ